MNKRTDFRIYTGDTLPLPDQYEDGDIFVEKNTLTVYLRDAGVWVPIAAAWPVTDAVNIGTGTGEVFESKVGSTLRFRTLKNNDGSLVIQTAGDEVQINLAASGPGAPVTEGRNVGGNYEVYRDKTGNTLNFRTLENVSSAYRILEGYGLDTIRFRGIANTGGGQPLVAGVSGGDIAIKGIESSSGAVIISDTGTSLDLDVDAGSLGAVTDGRNVGYVPSWSSSGEVYRDKTGTRLNFRRLAMIGAPPPNGKQILYGELGDSIRFRTLVARGDVWLGYSSDESLIIGSHAFHYIDGVGWLVYSGFNGLSGEIWVDNTFSYTFPSGWDDYEYLVFTAIVYHANPSEVSQINHAYVAIRYNGAPVDKKFVFGFGAPTGDHGYHTSDPAYGAAGSAVIGTGTFQLLTDAPSGSSWGATIRVSMNGYGYASRALVIGFAMWGVNVP